MPTDSSPSTPLGVRNDDEKNTQNLVVSKIFRNFVVPFAKVAQLVEHDLAKVGVASSSLVFRSD